MKYQATDARSNLTFTVRDRAWWLALGGLYAVTISRRTVWVRRTLAVALQRNPRLLNHEATHIRQARALGWRYLPRYLWLLVRAGLRKRRHPMEVVAYVNEPQHEIKVAR